MLCWLSGWTHLPKVVAHECAEKCGYWKDLNSLQSLATLGDRA